ncbi:MAG: dihydroorotate dehydrogenase electron transfer subunit [Candidatus Riflebacteria bacterium]|nr:dihydroorotate dehydrogenase electron transfer subunit [Candidatus Riflebacteria bacterium]
MAETMKTFQIQEINEYTETLKSFLLPKAFDVSPGQFVTLWIPGIDEKPFAISETTSSNFEITIRAVGTFTKRMMEMKKGDWIGIRGPFGNGFQLMGNTILVGGGCGNAPLKYLAQKLDEVKYDFTWIAGAKTSLELPFKDTLIANKYWIPMTDDGTYGQKGFSTDPLEPLIIERSPSVIYGSGPEPMLLEIRKLAAKYQVPVQLSFERYMKCGIGICGQCCLDGSGLRLCVEGPVLDEKAMAAVTEWELPHRSASGKRNRR